MCSPQVLKNWKEKLQLISSCLDIIFLYDSLQTSSFAQQMVNLAIRMFVKHFLYLLTFYTTTRRNKIFVTEILSERENVKRAAQIEQRIKNDSFSMNLI